MAEPMLCTQCGAITSPTRVTPGTVWITLVLLLFFIVPGIIYWLWRHSNTYSACRMCRSRNLVPTESPVGRDMIATRPSVAASLVEEKKGENDMFVGGVVLLGIVLVIAFLVWLSSK
jgi:hypothetical protein